MQLRSSHRHAVAGDQFAISFPVQPGEVIAGKYRVERILGAGGMGVVVAATHLQLGHAVAIKVLAPRSASCELAVPRFLQEARAAARIQNEHVVRVFDVGVLPDGPPYIAMEYLEGVDLDRILDERGPLPVAEAIECLLQACEGIGEAHDVGVIHRDLKPGNLVRCERPGAPPRVKVVDFGISKLLVAGDPLPDLVVTAPNEIMGSPLYASPEQIRAAPDVDARADIWALGAVAHALLAGKPPFMATTFSELCIQITQAPPEPLDEVRPDVPAGLAAVIRRCLMKDPAKRFHTVAELAAALAPFAPARALVSVERLACLAGPRVSELSGLLACARDTAPVEAGPPSDPECSVVHRGGVLRWAVAAAGLALITLAATLASMAASPVATAQMPKVSPPAATTLGAVASPVHPAVNLPPLTGAEPPATTVAPPALPSAPPPSRALRARPSRTSGFGGLL